MLIQEIYGKLQGSSQSPETTIKNRRNPYITKGIDY